MVPCQISNPSAENWGKNPLHFGVSLLDNFLNRQFWLFSVLSGRQLGHRSHTDSLSEQGSCQERGAGTPFGIGLLALFEVVPFAFRCNHHGNPQETPPHILVTNTQTRKRFVVRRARKKKVVRLHSNFYFYFFSTYDEFFALPFLAAGYRDLACFIQSGSVLDPRHCCSIPAELQKPALARPEVPPHPSPHPPGLPGHCPP